MWVARRLGGSLGVLRAPVSVPGHCQWRSFSRIDAVRQLLNEHRRVPARAGGNAASTSAPSGLSGASVAQSPVGNNADHAKEGDTVNTLVKELLRIFTRKVPGSLVPDELVRGFVHAYKQLGGTQERLDFFRLITRELGLSVNEVNTAVRSWDSAVARGAASIATSTPSQPQAAPSPLQWDAAYRAADRLASAATPLYSQLFVPISQAPDGMKFLVDMRADLMDVVAAATVAAPASAPAAAPNPEAEASTADGSSTSSSTHRGVGTAVAPSSTGAAGEAQEAGGHTTGAVAAAVGAAAPPAALTVSLEESAHLRAMAEQLRQLLAEWFSVGLLHLQHISWEESPAALLERVMRAEAVHPLGGSWEELRRRLGPRRRVFAFTHPCMPGEPLVVLHTALMNRPAACIDDILSHHDRAGEPPAACSPTPAAASSSAASGPTTAVFYSISSSQPGLKGIELGHFLIQRVAERLTAEHPSLRQLVTLSPLPNFRSWLTSQLQQQLMLPQAAAGSASSGASPQQQSEQTQPQPLLLPAEQVAVVGLARAMGWRCADPSPGSPGATAVPVAVPGPTVSPTDAAAALAWLLDGDRWLSGASGGSGDPAASVPAAFSPPYLNAPSDAANAEATAAAALSGPFAHPPQPEAAVQPPPPAAPGKAVCPGPDADAVLRPVLMRLAARYLVCEKRRSFALCPVANFHLRNGASLWRINWRADTSHLGLRRSLGIMCNYHYQLDSVYDNNRRYLLQHEVTTHPQVHELLSRQQ